MDWMKELSNRAKANLRYRQLLSVVKNREQDYLQIQALLTPGDQIRLDNYISACEELEQALIVLAYQLGQEVCYRITGTCFPISMVSGVTRQSMASTLTPLAAALRSASPNSGSVRSLGCRDSTFSI